MLKKISFKSTAMVMLAATLVATGCKKNQDAKFEGAARAGAAAVQEHIPVDANSIITVTHLTADKEWLIDGVSYVAPGQTLTIDPGTKLIPGNAKTYNDPAYGPQTLAGVLVVTKGAQLIANGTAGSPIVFTSNGATTAGQGASVVILGDAPVNPGTARIEGIPDPLPATVNVNYGGSNAADNSGSLQYVRIEYPGFVLSPNNEINGLTLGGVGSGTTLSHIQVSWSADDAFEFFGGTVNADHLVAFSNDDDDFDFDFGYSGTIQYGISLKNPASTNSTSSGSSDSNGLESDNDGSGSGATPNTKPVLRNFTFVGFENQTTAATKLKFGNRWRRATGLDIQNSIIIGYDKGVEFLSINAGNGTFSNNSVHGFTEGVASSSNSTPVNYVNNQFNTGAAPTDLTGDFAGNPYYAAGFTAANLEPISATYTAAGGAITVATGDWTATWTSF